MSYSSYSSYDEGTPEVNSVTTNTNTSLVNAKPHWTDRASTLIDSLAGLGSTVSGFFPQPQQNQQQPQPQPDPQSYLYGSPPPPLRNPPPPKKPMGVGTIILISVVGLGALGTAIYFMVRKKQ